MFIQKDNLIIEINTGEVYFNLNELPKNIQLNNCTKINDVKKFIESHVNYCNTYISNNIYKPYLDRLNELKNIL